jgi:hypothetical protein
VPLQVPPIIFALRVLLIHLERPLRSWVTGHDKISWPRTRGRRKPNVTSHDHGWGSSPPVDRSWLSAHRFLVLGTIILGTLW